VPLPSPPTPICRTYRVKILFREPTYELYNGPRAEPYFWTHDVRTTTEEVAVERATAVFLEMAKESSVMWIRKIVRTEVRVLGDREEAFLEEGRVVWPFERR